MDSNFLTNVPDPTADQHAATKAYVDANTQSAMKGTLVTDITLGSAAGTFDVEGWFDDSKYLYYEVHCIGFRISDNGGAVGIRTKNTGGSYPNGSANYQVSGQGISDSTNARNGLVTPTLSNSTSSGNGYASFVLRLPDNSSAVPSHKTIQSVGSSKAVDTGTFNTFGADTKSWNFSTFAVHSTGTIEGLRFVCIDSLNDTSASGQIRAGARVLVYGYEGLS